MRRYFLAALPAVAALVAACGSGASPSGTRTASPIATATSSVPAPGTAPAGTSPAPVPTDTAAARPAPSATAPPPGETGIDGTVTLGPTCPVQRIDSPCADRPYAAHITVWRDGVQVAETTSGSDGRFRLLLPPGAYHLVGESGGTFPRGSNVDAVVVQGRLTTVQIRYDTGIR
ncbi:MAG TPA: hypothetical protein VEZ14_05225 [Dehalococcoidia bacterium]|nr:hypothetical protein [Dehalococcoidia bacterium]